MTQKNREQFFTQEATNTSIKPPLDTDRNKTSTHKQLGQNQISLAESLIKQILTIDDELSKRITPLSNEIKSTYTTTKKLIKEEHEYIQQLKSEDKINIKKIILKHEVGTSDSNRAHDILISQPRSIATYLWHAIVALSISLNVFIFYQIDTYGVEVVSRFKFVECVIWFVSILVLIFKISSLIDKKNKRNIYIDDYIKSREQLIEKYKQDSFNCELKYKQSIEQLEECLSMEMEEVIKLIPTPADKGDKAILMGSLFPSMNYHEEIVRDYDAPELHNPYAHLELPLFLKFPNNKTLLFSGSEESRLKLIESIQVYCLRLAEHVKQGRIRFTFIDPLNMGKSASPFLELADFDERIITVKPWTDKRDIENKLKDILSHIENVSQKYLRNDYTSIDEYNQFAGDIAEPYLILTIFDFPTSFTREALEALERIVETGPHCGVYPVIHHNLSRPSEHHEIADEIIDSLHKQGALQVFEEENGELFLEIEELGWIHTELSKLPSKEEIRKVINKTGTSFIDQCRVEVPFSKLLNQTDLNENRWWTASSQNGLHIPLGPSGAKKIQSLNFGHGVEQHALLAGQTGSGKSSLLHTAICSLALKYSPEEVNLYLIDFKKGVEFKTYATYKLPHAKVIAIESEREFGISVLRGLDKELSDRGIAFRATGNENISSYRETSGNKMPRILLLVDEFQEFFSIDDNISTQAAVLLDRLIRQGRAFGIHVLLGTQTLTGNASLLRGIVDQVAIRIAMKCSENDSRLIFNDENTAAKLLSRPGEAIYNPKTGLTEGNSLFQVAYLSENERDNYLDRITKLAKSKQLYPPTEQFIFEGNSSPSIEQNQFFESILNCPTRLPDPQKSTIWIGEPLSVEKTTQATFSTESGKNLLIIGKNDKQAMGIFISSIISLIKQHEPSNAHIFLLDYGNVDTPYANLLKVISETHPERITYGKRKELSSVLKEISSLVRDRIDNYGQSLSNSPHAFLFTFGLHKARDLNADNIGTISWDTENNQTELSIDDTLNQIIKEGPELKVHTVLWCDTWGNFQRRIHGNMLKDFEMRIAMTMNEEDSYRIIESPLCQKLRDSHAYIYSDETGEFNKFSPFAIPNESWIKQTKTPAA